MKDCTLPEICECGQQMQRDFQVEHCAVSGDFKQPIISESLAFDAIDIKQHRADFPDIDVDVQGRFARPILKNLRQKRRYLKGRKWIDQNSFI